MRARSKFTAIVTVLLLLPSCITGTATGTTAVPSRAQTPVAVGEQTVVIAAAGDIACDPDSSRFNGGVGTETRCRMKATSDLVLTLDPDAVLVLGDLQYESASLENLMASYDLSWGRLKTITYPAIGNHEGESADSGEGYCSYFGVVANCSADGSQRDAAFYAFDVGPWHLIALNSNCGAAGGCDMGSPQHDWLLADLGTHSGPCTLAYWHHPRFSSGDHGNHTRVSDLFAALYDAGVELVLSGHDHDYERFAPQDPDRNADPERGVRQFVVGTGGKNLYDSSSPEPNSEVINTQTFGVLKLTLEPKSYSWEFISASGEFTDSGSDTCH